MHAYPPYPGGVGKVVESISTQLVRRGAEVEIVTTDPSCKLKPLETLDGMMVRRFPSFAPSNAYYLPSPKMLRYVSTLKADVVHVHNIGALTTPFCAATLKESRNYDRFVVSPHYHEIASNWHTRFFWIPYRPIAKLTLESANIVQCVSQFEGEKVKMDMGVSSIVVENGVDEEIYTHHWKGSNDVISLIYVGRLEKYKRVAMIIRAAEIVKRDGLDIEVKIVGSGSEEHAIKALANEYNVRITIMQNLSRSDLFKLYSTSDCLVNCSVSEAYSLVTAEALAIGLPVVVVRPWGRNFSRYLRAYIANPNPQSVSDGIRRSRNLNEKSVVRVPTWKEVADKLWTEVYGIT